MSPTDVSGVNGYASPEEKPVSISFRKLSNFKGAFDSALLGSLCALCRANKILQKRIDNCAAEQFTKDARIQHSRDDLKVMLTISIQRLERIENKAMGTLLGVAVAIAVFGATSGILGSDGLLAGKRYILQIVAAVLLIIAMLYLFASGFLALGAYRIGQVYRPMLEDCTPIANEEQEKTVLIYSIEQNQRAATMRSNRLSASFNCLRNGLVVVLILGITIAVVGVLS